MSNIYPFYYAKTFYDGMKSAGENEIVNLIRCAWIGTQRFGVVVWSFGKEAYEIIKELLFLRENKTLYNQANEKSPRRRNTGNKTLFLDFPEDTHTYTIEDEYMFGPDVLVAPVLYEGARRRKVYLPEGAKWTDASTGKVYSGGQTIECEAPLETVPVFLRDGANLPIRS